MGSENEIKAIRKMIDANREKLRHARAIILDAAQLIEGAEDRNEQIDQRLANLKPHRGPRHSAEYKAALGAYLRQVVFALRGGGLDQQEIAALVDVSSSQISKYIHGKAMPRNGRLERLEELAADMNVLIPERPKL